MTTRTYITGTRYPGAALRRFLPEYLETLLHRGESLLTTNKPGVDTLVIHHCDRHNLPLHVIEFACDSGDNYRNRRARPQSSAVTVQRVVSPSWQRFRSLAATADRMLFLHAGRSRGRCYGLTTRRAFELACRKFGIDGQQFIVQQQLKAWVTETELRQSPAIGPAHIYLNARFLPGLTGQTHAIGHFRLETWRAIGDIIQPGIGRRELVLPDLASRDHTLLHMLHQALLALEDHRPDRLILHYPGHQLQAIPYHQGDRIPYPDLRVQVRDLLARYPLITWLPEPRADLLQRIGSPISKAQELWDHKRRTLAYRGLYQ